MLMARFAVSPSKSVGRFQVTSSSASLIAPLSGDEKVSKGYGRRSKKNSPRRCCPSFFPFSVAVSVDYILFYWSMLFTLENSTVIRGLLPPPPS